MNGFKKMFHGTLICPKLLKVDIYRLYINIQYRYIIVMPKKDVNFLYNRFKGFLEIFGEDFKMRHKTMSDCTCHVYIIII